MLDDVTRVLARSGPPAVRSHKPAPKSAPPKTAYATTASSSDGDRGAHPTVSFATADARSVSALGP